MTLQIKPPYRIYTRNVGCTYCRQRWGSCSANALRHELATLGWSCVRPGERYLWICPRCIGHWYRSQPDA